MNIMNDNTLPNDGWPQDSDIDRLLSEAPDIADDDFSAGVTQLIDQGQKQRRLILGITYLLGFLVIGLITPWAHLQPLLISFSETVNGVGLKEGSITGWQPIALVLMPLAFFWAFLQREFS